MTGNSGMYSNSQERFGLMLPEVCLFKDHLVDALLHPTRSQAISLLKFQLLQAFFFVQRSICTIF